ncbi:hypothetical protein WJ0W_003540 [Paenibacillus melissococcoides]|uniref:Uncharacterized protein n=1 Tax=Paenibacillus melissococcoides TaxID=2912268 RepID=A0ABN8U9Y1_9BACL|nr:MULTISPECIES: hypothetical protein [Paenibacillus]GIO82255.1 hypothetical protein J6TS7_58650 [Paenibacillus dendritiformis]CAH8246305.1 hypothetical protein WJ0W_003540 [Paenibacillus melissococcoides]CAH8713571.1 hypothetical protein WDD9_003612 [Paenibacillus melissococcoides]CAH8714304.1 hypothetical protein HTL2_003915 [Paenibacillus melissococcoides]
MTIPKTAIDKVDFKSYHITRYADTVESLKSGKEVQFGPDTKVMFLTHSAQITGNVVDALSDGVDESETRTEIFLKTFMRTITNSIIKELSGDESGAPVESAAFSNIFKVINLKNVEVMMFSNPENIFSYNHMTLYTDQIVGISFGE